MDSRNETNSRMLVDASTTSFSAFTQNSHPLSLTKTQTSGEKNVRENTNFMAQARVGHSLNFLLFIYRFALSLCSPSRHIRRNHVINIEDELRGVKGVKG